MAAMRPALRLGLTGGIGSGKSTVAQLLQERGAIVIDADAISRACTQPGGSAMPAVVQSFGPTFIAQDGSLDRQRMREHVFTNPDARRLLESIVHPLVAQEVQRQAKAATSHCLVFDVPLLVESPRWRPQLDLVLVVDCETETQIRRVASRSGLDRTAIEGIINSQSPREERLAAADLVIFNNGNETEPLRRTVGQLADQIGL
ncbi:MAG: dephospho-CoA kinase [Betaproteobacteria bacterium HGW-Betaproteobacteria-9]|jgi:dephospho-CoA kinase|nr:dephospho-CoA kinase [Hydrogenophaga sp.]PKO31367.1 MAG: dephospho-CoA kinase [Betaproteobacteria bacterium HGW-Betaproteobacteria-9]